MGDGEDKGDKEDKKDRGNKREHPILEKALPKERHGKSFSHLKGANLPKWDAPKQKVSDYRAVLGFKVPQNWGIYTKSAFKSTTSKFAQAFDTRGFGRYE